MPNLSLYNVLSNSAYSSVSKLNDFYVTHAQLLLWPKQLVHETLIGINNTGYSVPKNEVFPDINSELQVNWEGGGKWSLHMFNCVWLSQLFKMPYKA